MAILVIDNISRYGGGGGYRGYGNTLPSYYTKSGSPDEWHGSTTGTIRELFGGAGRFYITEHVYANLTDAEIAELRPVLNGIMPNVYTKMVSKRSEFSGRTVYSWILIPGTKSRPVEPLDPCRDVTCPTACYGVDRYIQKCEDGACVRDRLLTRNSQDCGYEPPAPTPVPVPPKPTPAMHPIGTKVTHLGERWVVIGYEHPLTSKLYTMQALYDGRRTTATGELFAEITLPRRSCETYECSETRCYGTDEYTQACYGGVCVQGTLLEANSEECGYEKPDPTPTPTTDTYVYAIIALMVVGTYIMLR